MNNQGLEALAALATAAPSSSNRGAGEATRLGERAGGSREPSAPASGVGDNGSSTRDGQVQAHQSSQKGDHSQSTPSANQMAQWQQIMSGLAAQQGGNASSMAPNNQSLSFLSGMQHSAQSDNNSSLLMAMQNMAQYQMMAQSQAASHDQYSALSNLAKQLSRTNHQPAGLGFSPQNPFASLFKGKLLDWRLFPRRIIAKESVSHFDRFALRLG